MEMVCVGGGPAGLYFAVAAKARNAGCRITVLERNPANVTHGWGVTFGEELLDALYASDPESARTIHRAADAWTDQDVRTPEGRTVHLGGYGYSIGRQRLLSILVDRAVSLGVDVQFEHELSDIAELDGPDLIVACDGANSRVRSKYADAFGTKIETGANKYVWLGTHKVFDAFTYAFERTDAGLVWCYGYRYDDHTSTFIVECSPETWAGLGLDERGTADSLRLLEGVFARHLCGQALLVPASAGSEVPWLHFRRVSNASWSHRNVVMLGDAAHTTHFTLGSGTKLAMLDAASLASNLRKHSDLPTALAEYERDRRAALAPVDAEARSSCAWFEHVPNHIGLGPVRFAYSLWGRRAPAPAWRYPVHLGTQLPAVRWVRHHYSTAVQKRRARERDNRDAALVGAFASAD
jgi:2-polyprenyl-6-methoxyphenol hydroxylase-like FAD-dependent oxidoreductase